jgi:hypothetical protein
MILAALRRTARGAHRRLSAEHGFTMIVALGVMLVTSLLVAAVLVAVSGDTNITRHDLDSKRAYSAARAGLNAFLYNLDQNPNYWSTCGNDAAGVTPVPGASTPVSYSFQPIYNSGYSAATCSTNAVGALIDPLTGSLRVKFTGYSGASPQVSRTIVAAFRKRSPLDFLWYTVYETQDPATNSQCGEWYRQGAASSCAIVWANDVMNGPMYTQDQLKIGTGATPTFGRSKQDLIESEGPTLCTGSCGAASMKGTPIAPVPTSDQVAFPTSNAQLATDAQNHGQVYKGTVNVILGGIAGTGNARVVVCPTSTTCTAPAIVNLTTYPILAATNGSGCTGSYDPTNVTYSQNSSGYYYGPCGDIYVSGQYTTPLTISAGDNVVITGSLTTPLTGTATLGLVANQFVRVMHGIKSGSGCTSGIEDPNHTIDNPVIDAAILTLGHSFVVDNYNKGCHSNLDSLTVNGAIAQKYRGPVGTGNSTPTTGYSKNYGYDDRLHVLLPPFLFDIVTSAWQLSRETLCTASAPAPDSTSCSYTGT